MKAVILVMLKNAARMVLTRKVIIWGLKLAAEKTDNKIDDNFVSLGEALYDNDVEKVMESATRLVEELADKR